MFYILQIKRPLNFTFPSQKKTHPKLTQRAKHQIGIPQFPSPIFVFTSRNKVVGKVMFLLVFVILFMGGSASVHAGIPTPPGADTPPSRHTHTHQKQTPPRADPHGADTPPGKQTPAYGQ